MRNLWLYLFFLLFIPVGCFAGDLEAPQKTTPAVSLQTQEFSSKSPEIIPASGVQTPKETIEDSREDVASDVISKGKETPTPESGASEEEAKEEVYEWVRVKQVIEGGLIRIDRGEGERVKLIGVDTASAVSLSLSVNFWGHQAREFMRYACWKKLIRLEYDELFAEQNHKDDSGNTLAYAYLEDGRCLNEWIIREGLAFNKLEKIKYAEKYKKLTEKAMKKKKGFFSRRKSSAVR